MSHNQDHTHKPVDAARRTLLKAAGSAALAAPLVALGGNAWAQEAKPAGKKRIPLQFAWNQNSFCLTPVAVAHERGFFEKHGLDVSLVNFSGSTDSLLETISTGKSDAAVGMIHRWIKPLESGFNVKIVAGLHGGCVRLVAYKPTGITKIEDLRGKAIGVPDLAQPAKHFFSVYLKRNGIDPERDVTWRAYQGDLLGLAAEKSEIQAIAFSDPLLYRIERDTKGGFIELATNTSPPYHDKTCCVIGVGGELIKKNRPAVVSLVKALTEAYEWTNANQLEGAKVFQKYATNLTLDELMHLYKQLTLHVHPTGQSLRDQLVFYAQDFKDLNVLKPTTNPEKLIDHIFVPVL